MQFKSSFMSKFILTSSPQVKNIDVIYKQKEQSRKIKKKLTRTYKLYHCGIRNLSTALN